MLNSLIVFFIKKLKAVANLALNSRVLISRGGKDRERVEGIANRAGVWARTWSIDNFCSPRATWWRVVLKIAENRKSIRCWVSISKPDRLTNAAAIIRKCTLGTGLSQPSSSTLISSLGLTLQKAGRWTMQALFSLESSELEAKSCAKIKWINGSIASGILLALRNHSQNESLYSYQFNRREYTSNSSKIAWNKEKNKEKIGRIHLANTEIEFIY